MPRQDEDIEGWDWKPAEPDSDSGSDQIGQWVDSALGEAVSENAQPYEQLDRSEIGRRLLRNARLAVTDHCDDVEDARYWLAGLGLIPDPFEPAPNNRGPFGRMGRINHKRKD